MFARPQGSTQQPTESDIWISGVGYEGRATHAFSKRKVGAETKVAIDFQDNQVLSYEENKKYFSLHDFAFIPFIERPFSGDTTGKTTAWIKKLCSVLEQGAAFDKEAPPSVTIDISVMSRDMMALVLEAVWHLSKKREIVLTLVYSPTSFYKPKDNAPIAYAGPASNFFSGWRTDPQAPIALVLGVGFEADRIIWAQEELEPARTVLFAPLGYEERFDSEMLRVNRPLFESMFGTEWIIDRFAEGINDGDDKTDVASMMDYAKRQIVPFNVANPIDLFVKLDAVCFSLLKYNRVIICPFGPKIFSAVSMLIGIAHFPRIAIWRISGNVVAEPEDRFPAGGIISGSFLVSAFSS